MVWVTIAPSMRSSTANGGGISTGVDMRFLLLGSAPAAVVAAGARPAWAAGATGRWPVLLGGAGVHGAVGVPLGGGGHRGQLRGELLPAGRLRVLRLLPVRVEGLLVGPLRVHDDERPVEALCPGA